MANRSRKWKPPAPRSGPTNTKSLGHPWWVGVVLPLVLATAATFTPDVIRGILLVFAVAASTITFGKTEFANRRPFVISLAFIVFAAVAVGAFLGGHALDARNRSKPQSQAQIESTASPIPDLPNAHLPDPKEPKQASAKKAKAHLSQTEEPRDVEDGKPISATALIVKSGQLTPRDAKSIAESAQQNAAEILNCVASHPEYDAIFCTGIYGKYVAEVRDEIHNHGVEFPELNATVQQLESKPTLAVLKRSAAVLRAVADKTLTISQDSAQVTSKGATEPSLGPIPKAEAVEEKPVFVRHDSGKVIMWLGHGTGFIRNHDGLQINVRSSGVAEPGHSLASGEVVEYDIMRSSSGVEAVNVKVIPTPPRTDSPPSKAAVQPKEPVPTNVSLGLPARITLSKFDGIILSERSGHISTAIKVCIVDQTALQQSTDEVARFCNYLYARQVAEIRNKLRNSGIIIDPLQDVVRRMERGATAEELQYTAIVMDVLSQELGKRSK